MSTNTFYTNCSSIITVKSPSLKPKDPYKKVPNLAFALAIFTHAACMEYLPALGETWPHSRENVGKYSLHGAYGRANPLHGSLEIHSLFGRRGGWLLDKSFTSRISSCCLLDCLLNLNRWCLHIHPWELCQASTAHQHLAFAFVYWGKENDFPIGSMYPIYSMWGIFAKPFPLVHVAVFTFHVCSYIIHTWSIWVW